MTIYIIVDGFQDVALPLCLVYTSVSATALHLSAPIFSKAPLFWPEIPKLS